MNKFEEAVMRFANDLAIGSIVPTKVILPRYFVFNEKQFNEDKDILSELEWLLRHEKAKIIVEDK